MTTFQLPEATDFPAAVFTHTGEFVMVGSREECEEVALTNGQIYCWVNDGKVIVRYAFDSVTREALVREIPDVDPADVGDGDEAIRTLFAANYNRILEVLREECYPGQEYISEYEMDTLRYLQGELWAEFCGNDGKVEKTLVWLRGKLN